MEAEPPYIDRLSREDRIAQVFRTMLRLYLSSHIRSRGERKQSLSHLAIEFEIEQAARLAPEPHTVSSLSATLDMSVKAASRIVRDLVRWGVIEQHEAANDARIKYLVPTQQYYANGGDAILVGIQEMLQQAFGDGWRDFELRPETNWFPDVEVYSQASSDIARFRTFFKFQNE